MTFWALPVLATPWMPAHWLELPPSLVTVNDWSTSPLSASCSTSWSTLFGELPVLVPPAMAGTASTNTIAAMATKSSSLFKKMRFILPPSFILASLLALRLLIGSRPLVFPSFYKLPRYKFPRTLRYLIDNTAEFGAQDEPFLRSTTLTLCLKVRANLPYFALYTQGSVLRKRTPD